MAKVEPTSDARVLVGIDISRHRHERIAVPGKTRPRRLTITNNTDDFQRLMGRHRDQHRRSRANRSLAAAAFAHGQLLLPTQPEELLVVHGALHI